MVLVFLAGCGKGDLPEGATREDRDGDGLSNVEEAQLGSNPDAADTDRDGWDDGVEVSSYTDPLNGYDHPYTGGWRIDPCRNDLAGQGFAPGMVVDDWSLMDQHGDGVRIHDFCGQVVVIASAAEWCQPCQQEARLLATLYDKYASAGLMVLTLLGEDADMNTPSRDELQAWADAFGIHHPVLQDLAFSVSVDFIGQNTTNLPSNHMISRGGVVRTVDQEEITEAMILEALEE